MHRGVRREELFEEEMDYQVFLEILKSGLEKYECILHAYCLMTNHIHLLLETTDIEVGKFMKFLSERYAMYINHKYLYRGHVFESRCIKGITSVCIYMDNTVGSYEAEK